MEGTVLVFIIIVNRHFSLPRSSFCNIHIGYFYFKIYNYLANILLLNYTYLNFTKSSYICFDYRDRRITNTVVMILMPKQLFSILLLDTYFWNLKISYFSCYHLSTSWELCSLSWVHLYLEERKRRKLILTVPLHGDLIYTWPSGFHIHGFNQLWIKNNLRRKKKIPGSSKMQNLSLPCAEHYTEPMWRLWYVGIPCCKLYANSGYMQVLCPFI